MFCDLEDHTAADNDIGRTVSTIVIDDDDDSSDEFSALEKNAGAFTIAERLDFFQKAVTHAQPSTEDEESEATDEMKCMSSLQVW